MLKGERCLTAKCAFARRSYGPGQHGQNFRGKRSEYGKQLREKQKTRKIYGIDEQQFANYVLIADKMEGNNAANLMTVLELRLDNIIFRTGLAVSRSQARQFAAHGLFQVNGRTSTIPSMLVKPGDVITPKNEEFFKVIETNCASTWIDYSAKKMTATIKHIPSREEIDTVVNENLIIEYYSR